MEDENNDDVYYDPRYEENDENMEWDPYGEGRQKLNQYDDGGEYSGESIELKSKSTTYWQKDDIEEIMGTISDPKLLENLKKAFAKIDGYDLTEYNAKTAFTSAIETTSLLDELDVSEWEKKISVEDRIKFDHEQKVNNLNSAFQKSGVKIYINVDSKNTFEFLKDVETTYTDKKREINGYMYRGKKIILRNRQREFYFDFKNQAATIDIFLENLNNTGGDAWSELSNYYQYPVEKSEAENYIKNMRDEEITLIDNAGTSRDLKNNFRDFIEMEKEIKKVKFNQKVKLRLNVLKKSVFEYLRRLKNWAWKNRKKTGFTLFTLIVTIASGIGSTIPLLRRIKNAGDKLKEISNQMKKIGSDFYELTKDPSGIFRYPLMIPATLFAILGQILAYFSIFSKLGFSWANFVIIFFLTLLGKFYVIAYDYIKPIFGGIAEKADFIQSFLTKSEKLAYLNSGRDIPPELLINDELKKYENELVEYEEKLEEYEVEKEAAKRENTELMGQYEREMIIYRKMMKEYQVALKQKEAQISELEKMKRAREREINDLTLMITELGTEVNEKQKDVDFWETKFKTEKDGFNYKLSGMEEKHRKQKLDLIQKNEEERARMEKELRDKFDKEKENIKNEDKEKERLLKYNLEKIYEDDKRHLEKQKEQEKLNLQKSLELKFESEKMQEQKVYHHRITLLQDKLNKATEERDKLLQEKKEKEKEKEEVKSKSIINIKYPKQPTLPSKPKLVPTVKKPKKPEIPHQKMKLDELKNKNPTWKTELMFWIKLPAIKILQLFPWALKTFSAISLQLLSWGLIFGFCYFIYYIINKWRII